MNLSSTSFGPSPSPAAPSGRGPRRCRQQAFVGPLRGPDSVQHQLFFQSLRSLGVPPALLAVIEAAYCDNTLSIINGECPVSASMLSGVKQGCPLSPLLFCLALNPVLEAVHRERGSDSDACVGYMDDLLVFSTQASALQ